MKHRIRCPRSNRMRVVETSRPHPDMLISQYWWLMATEDGRLIVDRDDGIVGYRFMHFTSNEN